MGKAEWFEFGMGNAEGGMKVECSEFGIGNILNGEGGMF
jgi:hypothetical protein